MKKTRVTFETAGGTLAFERNEYGISMWMEDDTEGSASLLFNSQEWAELCDFFAHPEVNERFDAETEDNDTSLGQHAPNDYLPDDDVPR